ncbi:MULTISPECIES: D-alanyl-D-alanine carboxypeptidase family protein [unclassified Salinicola]|uniref:D-alanyl-D-alanine carboxypeptidase family protein n=1 Tax=unclassified Salinicola TaxID=2634022 RepID=UPI001A8CD428|nr:MULTISPECIES: D-alanyl-D-alanine carboxypeptidase family protein [unclassified Salinicola]MCE3025422.1 D-alanyl-D-alanine carboxypeptidase [Salinicola sp. DM10]WIX34441.1 D-alanyl-D-alanine carboxypeptidase family protein [Salinicola sp. JS01]
MKALFTSSLPRWVLSASLCLGLLTSPAGAQQQPTPDSQMPEGSNPQPEQMIPSPPDLAASSWVLMDAATGQLLVNHNGDQRLPPASLTKMMTAYIVEQEIERGNIHDSDMVSISENAWRTGGSRMFIREGTQVSVKDLLHGVVIQSGNDASVALSEYIAGSESAFADLMNQQAQRMGMQNSHFMNPTGLPHDDHYSSAHDLAILARHIIEDYPDHYKVYSQKYFTYNDIRQPNRNRLLWRDPDVDGLKTGHTEAAGFCLVASAKKQDTRLIAVVMGTQSDEARAAETQRLLNYGFRFYQTRKLYDAGSVLNQARVWGGAQDTVRLGVQHEVSMTVPRGSADNLTARLNIPETLHAPIQAGQQIGTLEIKSGDKVLGQEPLVALEGVEEGSIFKRVWDSIVLFVTGLFN